MVVAPATAADEAHRVAREELGAAGLAINADETAVWAPRPVTQLPPDPGPPCTPGPRSLRAAAPCVDPEGPLPRLSVNGNADGDAAVREAERRVSRFGSYEAPGSTLASASPSSRRAPTGPSRASPG